MLSPTQNANKLVDDCQSIWLSGVRAVTPERLMRDKLRRDISSLIIDEQLEIDLQSVSRLIIVGAGKAAAAMAAAFVSQLQQLFPEGHPPTLGWINAPEGTFQQQLPNIHLHAARPAGLNCPTQAAIEGTRQIIELVRNAQTNDVVICLISGGGSALLVSPQPGVTLQDKQQVAQLLAAAGGTIDQINTVRRCLSRVKGGGLARACRAGRLVSLIISDVLGDSLDVIASGPTVIGQAPNCRQALEVIRSLELTEDPKLQNVLGWLNDPANANKCSELERTGCAIEHVVLGNLADAVDAAGVRAVELGYRYLMQTATRSEGDVAEVAAMAVSHIRQMKKQIDVDCWISGGEPTVKLPKLDIGLGGRNQHLTLSVLELLMHDAWFSNNPQQQLVFLSAGTDGEDGPTNAAGAWFDARSIVTMQDLDILPNNYLQRADAYHFFEKVGGLFVTGPTGTNVCDLRICLTT
jgi:glycerate 2-kinase